MQAPAKLTYTRFIVVLATRQPRQFGPKLPFSGEITQLAGFGPIITLTATRMTSETNVKNLKKHFPKSLVRIDRNYSMANERFAAASLSHAFFHLFPPQGADLAFDPLKKLSERLSQQMQPVSRDFRFFHLRSRPNSTKSGPANEDLQTRTCKRENTELVPHAFDRRASISAHSGGMPLTTIGSHGDWD